MKSAIFTANNSAVTLATGTAVPVGSTRRRFGCNLQSDGSSISLSGSGYYEVTVTLVATATAAGTVGFTVQRDGVDVVGSSTSLTAAAVGNAATVTSDSVVRLQCCAQDSVLTVVYRGTAAATLSNLAVVVKKL